MRFTAFEVSDGRVNSSGKGENTSMTIQGWVAGRSNLPTPKSCQYWRESHFILHTHCLRLWVFVIQQLFATGEIHLEQQISICAGCHMDCLRICALTDLIFAGAYCQSWTRELDSSQILVTRDESWLVLEYQHSTKWNVAQDAVSTRASQTISTRTVTLIVIRRIYDFTSST
jgi:hypothetical protein